MSSSGFAWTRRYPTGLLDSIRYASQKNMHSYSVNVRPAKQQGALSTAVLGVWTAAKWATILMARIALWIKWLGTWDEVIVVGPQKGVGKHGIMRDAENDPFWNQEILSELQVFLHNERLPRSHRRLKSSCLLQNMTVNSSGSVFCKPHKRVKRFDQKTKRALVTLLACTNTYVGLQSAGVADFKKETFP